MSDSSTSSGRLLLRGVRPGGRPRHHPGAGLFTVWRGPQGEPLGRHRRGATTPISPSRRSARRSASTSTPRRSLGRRARAGRREQHPDALPLLGRRPRHAAGGVTVPVRISRQTCKRCGHIAGGSFASIVQVRADGRDPTDDERERAEEIAQEYVAAREETGDRNAFITETKSVDDGLDIKISTNQMGSGRREAESPRNSAARTPTHGVSSPRTRTGRSCTGDLRRPPAPLPTGDVIDPEDGDGPVLVRRSRATSRASVWRPVRLRSEFEAGETPDARRLGFREDGQRRLRRNRGRESRSVLDPETLQCRIHGRTSDFDADEVPGRVPRAQPRPRTGDRCARTRRQRTTSG